MDHRYFGYARVSSTDQNEDRQLIALKKAGVPDQYIFQDKLSGKDFNRPAYQKMLKTLHTGDVLFLLSIDRLGRNYEEIQNQWRTLTKKTGVDICVLDMPLLDTRVGKDLLGTFISDLILQILSFVAETERESIRKRQQEGIAAARALGKHLGRRPNPLPEGFEKACLFCFKGTVSTRCAADSIGMKHSTFYRHFCVWKNVNNVSDGRRYDT